MEEEHREPQFMLIQTVRTCRSSSNNAAKSDAPIRIFLFKQET